MADSRTVSDQPSAKETADVLPPSASSHAHRHPQSIGHFRILEVIGEGGMGIVYKAEQRQPVRRVVALKVIKLGMDTKEVIARFDAERQALALMTHPNIARVLDAGVTETGRPFVAMEYVPGVPLTDYCEQAKLTTRQRLKLFIPICHAIQHAHQKGIIHRDLKPSNILVTMVEGKPAPKVIDFGIAKAINHNLTQQTLFTQTGALIGTPEYMSPEQAMTSGLDVDTRTDVYSLGVILYELLSGSLPFDTKELRSAGLEGIARMIRETEPPKPSTKLYTIDAKGAADIAARHRTDTRSLRRELSGDLDWITLRAMEKDRTRRYDSAEALADDLKRHLENEPVRAGPPTARYRLGKFLRKHRVAVAAGGLVAIALVLGLIGTAIGFVRARAALDRAITLQIAEANQRAAADRARDAADRARVAAEQAKTQADTANQFLRDLLMSRAGDSRGGLQAAVARLDQGWLKDQPATLVACRIYLAWAYVRMEVLNMPQSQRLELARKEFQKALALLRQATGSEPPAAAAMIYYGLGTADHLDGQLTAAAGEFQTAWANFKKVPNSERDQANVANELAAIYEAQQNFDAADQERFEKLILDLAAMASEFAQTPDSADLLLRRANLKMRLGQFNEAIPDIDRLIEKTPDDHWPWYLKACLSLYLGDEDGYRKTCEQMLKKFGKSDNPRELARTAKACLLSANPVEDPEALRKLATSAAKRNAGSPQMEPWAVLTQMLALYRTGNGFPNGINTIQGNTSIYFQPTRDLLLAAAFLQKNETLAARNRLTVFSRSTSGRFPRAEATDLQDPQDYMVLQILRREFEPMILSGRSTAPTTRPTTGSAG